MKKSEAKALAAETIQKHLAVVNYTICDSEQYSEEEKDMILAEINKQCTRMLKTIGKDYIAY